MSVTLLQIARLVLVLVLLIVATVLATPPGRLPLALRGVYKIMKRDGALPQTAALGETRAPLWKRLLAFVLVLISLGLALI